MSGVVIGIDTSNYTTSVAVIDESGELLANLKRPLSVKQGERGLRQSDALFLHTVNLPSLIEEAGSIIEGRPILAVGVSDRPRNAEGSYMPCFLAGVPAATGVSVAAGAPLYRFSHQCGHIMAALYSSGRMELSSERFTALHVSGGTTEMLSVTPAERGFNTEIVGGTKDLNAGQVIDRIGVYMGFPFPAGMHLEDAARKNTKPIPRRKLAVDGCYMNLSGVENMAVQLYRDTGDVGLTSAFVLDFIGRSILSVCEAREAECGKMPFVFAGGVMSNGMIKDILSRGRDSAFAEPMLSADNAVGIAVLALSAYNSEN